MSLSALLGCRFVVGQASTLNRGVLLLVLLALPPAGVVRARWGWWPYVLAAFVVPAAPSWVVGLVFLGVASSCCCAPSHRPAQPPRRPPPPSRV